MPAVSLVRRKDVLGGVLVCVLGIAAIALVRGNSVGTLGRMGPGFFPTLVGTVMVLTGAAIAVGGVRAQRAEAVAAPDLRAWILIPLSLVAFVVIGDYAGLLPATFAAVFVAALADRDNTWRGALALAASMVAVCLVVFWWALQVQFPLLTIGPDW